VSDIFGWAEIGRKCACVDNDAVVVVTGSIFKLGYSKTIYIETLYQIKFGSLEYKSNHTDTL
jgi:hypothetical protein